MKNKEASWAQGERKKKILCGRPKKAGAGKKKGGGPFFC